MITVPGLECKHCSRPILLPSPTHPGIPPRQLLWPVDARARNFLCLQCMNVCPYSSEDVRLFATESTVPDPANKYHGVVCAEVSCGTPGCETPIRILALAAYDVDPVAEAARLLHSSRAERIGCGRLHYIQGPLEKTKLLEAYFDDDWEVLF